jgi:N-acetylated-alpha-linked acidic dipeptidase
MDVPRIPVVPISWANAAALLEPLRGAALPAQSWQGGLPFRYHVGGDATVQARVGVWLEPAARHVKTIVNTVGILRGATQPDEWVLTGAHRDGWGPGATDNVAGTAVVLASAEAFGAAAARGQRPARSLVFLTWDAEEWGIIGSTEWAEDHADELRAKAVAYLNQDGTVGGRRFGASATASLHGFVREAASAVGQPGDTGSVRAAWERASGGAPRFGDLGGGSDFFGFYNYLGIPSFDFGFGGPGGVYHSQYDSYAFVERFADPGYLAHVAAAQLNATMLARLANADLLPFDYGAYGRYLGALAPRIAEAAQGARLDVDPAPLAAAAARLAAAGDAFAATRDSVLAAGRARRDALARANAALRTVEHALTRESGLAGRPRARNLVFAADRDNGYSNMPFPSVLEAIRDGDAKRAQAEVVELAGRIDDARARVEAARRALGGA